MLKNLNKRKKILLLILIVVSIISTFWLYLQTSKTKEVEVLPTPIPLKFELIKSIPQSGSVSTIPVSSNIEFYFSKQVDVSSADVTILPYVPLSFDTDLINKAFYIRAIPSWNLDQEYKLTIRIKSIDGDILPTEINYSFRLDKMKDSLLTE
jgi:hypothetical protein